MAVDPLIGASIGSYSVSSKIGVGGMGAVYMGVHPLIGKRVAIKVLHAEFAEKADVVQRFFQEARAVSLLRHPHIVELIDFGKLDSQFGSLHYCVMELLEGELLRDRIKRGPISEADAGRWTTQVADAVGAAHRQQIVHRDLKPENIFLVGAKHDFVKILDFGIAKLTGQGQASMQTQAGTLLGTPSYMSPEQCMARPVDARTDVYALGIILFEMCTGRVPFVGEGYADLLIKQINGELPSPRSINPNLSVGMERVIVKALEKEPANRFQSMEEFQAALASPGAIGAATKLMATADPTEDATVVGGAMPTTLSGAAGEVGDLSHVPGNEAPRRRGSLGAVVGIGLGLVVAGVVLGVVLLRGDKTSTGGDDTQNVGQKDLTKDPKNGGGKIEPPPLKKMHLHVASEPVGAEVRRENGAVLGQTPLDTDLVADNSMLKLVIHKEGFRDELRAVILTERDRTLTFALKAEAAVEPPKPDRPKDDHHHRPSTHHSSSSKNQHLGDDILKPDL